MLNTKLVPLLLLLVLPVSSVSAAEFRPVAVWTEAECYATPPGRYAAERMIDGDLGSYACLLDDSRTGSKQHGGLAAQGGATGDGDVRIGSGGGTDGFGHSFRRTERLGLRAGEEREPVCLRRRTRTGRDQAAGREAGVAGHVEFQFGLCGMGAGEDAVFEGVRPRLVSEALSRTMDARGADSVEPEGWGCRRRATGEI